MRQPQLQAFVGVELAARKHHLDHSVGAQNAAHPHCRTAAHKNSATALGELEDNGRLCNANMGRGGQFQPAANYSTGQGTDSYDTAELDQVCNAMPLARVVNGFFCVARNVFCKVETRTKMPTAPMQHHNADIFGQTGIEFLDLGQQPVRHSVALILSDQLEFGDLSAIGGFGVSSCHCVFLPWAIIWDLGGQHCRS